MVGILFLKVQKSILFCLLSLSAIYFTIRGFQQVTKEQISTKTEYRYGDDNDGNINLLAMTVCPQTQESYAEKFRKGYALNHILDDSQADFSLQEILQFMKLDSNDGNNMTYDQSAEKGWVPKWEHILDWQQGHCYTFNPKYEGLTKIPIISYNVFDNSQIQQFKFKVCTTVESLYDSIFKQLQCSLQTNDSLWITFYDPDGIYTFARNSRGHVFSLPSKRMQQFRMTKSIVKALSTKQKPCNETIYYGKESCIEDRVSNNFLSICNETKSKYYFRPLQDSWR